MQEVSCRLEKVIVPFFVWSNIGLLSFVSVRSLSVVRSSTNVSGSDGHVAYMPLTQGSGS